MDRLSKDEMKLLAAMIAQFLKERGSEESVILMLIHELELENGQFSGTMSYMSNVPPEPAAHILEYQAGKIRAGRRGELMLIHPGENTDATN